MIFRFPSVSAAIKGSLDTVKRFPLPLLSAILASGICIYILDFKWEEQKKIEYLRKIVMCCWLGLILFLSMTLISEKRGDNLILKCLIQFIGIFILAGYYFFLPDFNKMTITDVSRYALFATGLHLLVAFSPFTAGREINGFWQFNKTLFLRFLLSVLYSGALFLGLALALLAVDQLFNVDIKEERYGQLWFFMAGIFNTWFFLAGIPKNLDELESITDYPKGLKIFTQFVLLPLVTVYLLILYAYGIKIIMEWELPKGWVSWMVNAFSVFGILCLLLIWPIRNDEGNKWISAFSRWFYRALFPLIVLLGVAIGKRVMQYGITENRYFVMIVALWLTGIAVYFLASKEKNIKFIPITLCIMAFLSSFGPWGAFSVSEKSQVRRLEKLLIEEKILVDGKIIKATDTIPEKSGRQIFSIVQYLGEHHRFDAIKPWFKENLDTLLVPKDSGDYVDETGKILALMVVEDNIYFRYRDEDKENDDTSTGKNFYYHAEVDRQQAISVAGFDYSCNFDSYSYDRGAYFNESYYPVHFGKDSGLVKYSDERKNFVFNMNGEDVLQLDFREHIKKISDYYREHKKTHDGHYVPKEMMLFEARNDSVRVQLHATTISGTKSKNEIKIDHLKGMMLLKLNSSTDTSYERTE